MDCFQFLQVLESGGGFQYVVVDAGGVHIGAFLKGEARERGQELLDLSANWDKEPDVVRVAEMRGAALPMDRCSS